MTAVLLTGGAGLAGVVTFLILYLYWKGKAKGYLADKVAKIAELEASEKRFDASQQNLAAVEAQVRVVDQIRAAELVGRDKVIAGLEAQIKKLKEEKVENATPASAASSLNEALKKVTR